MDVSSTITGSSARLPPTTLMPGVLKLVFSFAMIGLYMPVIR